MQVPKILICIECHIYYVNLNLIRLSEYYKTLFHILYAAIVQCITKMMNIIIQKQIKMFVICPFIQH